MKLPAAADELPGPLHIRLPNFWCYCFILLALKVFLLALDPNPKTVLGDSASYLWTAFSGWIPYDRSFLYGYVIRWTSLGSGSLTSLLLLQTVLSTIVAVFVALTCALFFNLTSFCSYLFGFICALDPLTLVWERYVMAETISLFLYATMLLCILYYVRQKRLWQLVIIQLVGVLLISFRISYLLVVEAGTVLWPLLACFSFTHQIRSSKLSSPQTSRVQLVLLHLGVSIGLFLALHLTYKGINGALAGRPLAYLYTSGFSLLAAWAPALLPEDSPDPRLAQVIAAGDQFQLGDIHRRNNQLYSQGALISRWKSAETNLAVADKIAQQTALHSFWHRPWGIADLGLKTFLSYFERKQIRQQAKVDLGNSAWPAPMAKALALRLRISPPKQHEGKAFTVLQRYFLAAQAYWYVVLFSPLLCAILFFFTRDTYVFILLAQACIFLATNCLLTVTASVRYLQPLSLVTILAVAMLVKLILRSELSRPITHTA